MTTRMLLGVLAVWVTTGVAAASAPVPPPPPPVAAYLQALRVADLFLAAWAKRDVDAGLALMSSAALSTEPFSRVGVRGGPRQYLSGTSNPHHQAFEISAGKQAGPDRFAFPVRLFELYSGEPSGVAYSDTLEVVRQGSEWRVDRLPRNYNPD